MRAIGGETKPVTVSDMAKQTGETRTARWGWVERSIWTNRMLEALETGVKGGVWFSLIDKVYRSLTLHAAWQAVRRVYIDKLGSTVKRLLGIPAVRDRVVQAALRLVIEPILEKRFTTHSYGFQPNKGCKDALREVDRLMKAGYTWVVDTDLKAYFDSIPHERLIQEVSRYIADGRMMGLIESFLRQDILEGLARWTPEQGTPQGAVISPMLANLYLHPVDVVMETAGFQMIRYADDCAPRRCGKEAEMVT